MQKRHLFVLSIFSIFFSCYQPERNCKDFKNGTFTYTATIDGEEKTTTFVRNGTVEIDFFESKSDTSSVRWLNDCEYIVKKMNPKNKAEEKSIHMKIMSTTKNSYTFEYGVVGSSKKTIGTAIKTK
ncbi:DNA topoisomerase IV [Costertonia aggregata]|uniref:DNA topoisomerase IV n=1 Tax=Costertonia aggregata TaxID=343403 RepID=A0A7H9AUB5_9FLAO|nr:DNA topoisomerase IV [Costertonia aggregata]QLG47078.1 DNA topoisomerase IV [Costertonia aggregata]